MFLSYAAGFTILYKFACSLSLFNIFAVLKYMYIHGYQNQLIWNMIEIDKYNNESNVHTLYKLNIVLNISAYKLYPWVYM